MSFFVRCIVKDKMNITKVNIMNDNKEYREVISGAYADGLIEFSDDMIMCLCPKCREMFFSTPGYVIKRVDKEQEAKDNCSYCTVRLGFDYYVCEKPKKEIFTNHDFYVKGANQKIAPLAD